MIREELTLVFAPFLRPKQETKKYEIAKDKETTSIDKSIGQLRSIIHKKHNRLWSLNNHIRNSNSKNLKPMAKKKMRSS